MHKYEGLQPWLCHTLDHLTDYLKIRIKIHYLHLTYLEY